MSRKHIDDPILDVAGDYDPMHIINPFAYSVVGGGFSYINSTGVTNGFFAGTITTPAIDTTGADLFVAVSADYLGNTVSDSYGNTWFVATGDAARSSGTVQVYYCKPTSVGPGHTFSFVSNDRAAFVVAAFSGSAASPLDQTSYADADQAGSITPIEAGSLVIAGFGAYNGAQSSINEGFNFVAQAATFPGSAALAYLIQSTAAAVNPTWSPGGSNRTALLASFLPA